MEFNVTPWIQELVAKILATFGDRVLYIGHNGSYARGEATETSDIDVNVILDRLTLADLQNYRALVQGMNQSEKACGFICGRDEIRAWPKHELFQFTRGSQTLFGSLDGLIDPPADADIRENIRNTVSMIYHDACHHLVYGEDPALEVEALQFDYKLAFFAIQEMVYLNRRLYLPTKKALLTCLQGTDRTVMETLIHWPDLQEDRATRPLAYFSALIAWSSAGLKSLDNNVTNCTECGCNVV
jgi:hypothetical protein